MFQRSSGPEEARDSRETRPPLEIIWLSIVTEPFARLHERMRGRRCPHCDVQVRANEEHCGRCGGELTAGMFSLGRSAPLSLEAIGVFAVLVLLAGLIVWSQVEPILWRVAPGFLATKSGPDAFPVVVRIGQAGLGVTNGSSARWTCNLAIASEPPARANVALAPGESRDVPYGAFSSGPARPSDRAGYLGARRTLDVRCVENSGVRRYIRF